MRATVRVAEVRAEHLLTELLVAQGWDVRRPPNGDVLRQHEYKNYPHLLEILCGHSKTGQGGDGLPEAILVDPVSIQPLAVIEAKADVSNLSKAINEVTQTYGQAFIDDGFSP